MEVPTSNPNVELEILVSTMNQNSLSFLDSMFPYCDLSSLHILVVNQTKKGKELSSSSANIRVINSYEKGLSKSRNLAIENAVGNICLISDDDVQYVKGFQNIVAKAFEQYTEVSIIRFKIDTFSGQAYKKYPDSSTVLTTRKSIKSASSIEIGFRKKTIIKYNIKFNAMFGLGGIFPSGEEYLFLKDTLKKCLKVYFYNETIVKHGHIRSTSNAGSDDRVKTIAAINYIDFKHFSYLLVLKHVYFLIKNNFIKINDAIFKIQVGFKGINSYKKLKNKR
ncbi:glycosyltransferase family A protein [uncultured Algibacter sp.]|uniref:glycosyltransferase family A protein n=1 Tax=uncultured Algibacter sp. TaxID=298659 RepID=UPI00261D5FA0|nr:glycosyltransferase family A protein [uncultured Algibacter sp.]